MVSTFLNVQALVQTLLSSRNTVISREEKIKQEVSCSPTLNPWRQGAPRSPEGSARDVSLHVGKLPIARVFFSPETTRTGLDWIREF